MLYLYCSFDKENHAEVADKAVHSRYLDEEAGVSGSSSKHESATTSSSYKGNETEVKKIWSRE